MQYTIEQSNALTSIHRAWRASFNTSSIYPSATARFIACRDLVANYPSYPGSAVAGAITVGMFFDYIKSINKSPSYRVPPRHAMDDDFDDIGSGHIEREYRDRQKRKHRRF